MKRTMLSMLAVATVAAGTSIGASAKPRVYIERHDGPTNNAYQSREYDEHYYRRCDAPQWDANHLYMPGETVRRKGEVYVATETSRHVYNVNSPPEWTPNYWAPARCR